MAFYNGHACLKTRLFFSDRHGSPILRCPSRTMKTPVESEIYSINRIQLLLSEKRTSLSVMRTGIAIFALPLSVFSVLIATSKYYDAATVWHLLALVSLLNFTLIGLGVFLIVRSLLRMHHYDQAIAEIKLRHEALRQLP